MHADLPADLQEIIYVSTLADHTPALVVADIASEARICNQRADITGLLVFDGLHFCQQLEGCPVQIAATMERIGKDPRHYHLTVVHTGPLAQRRFRRFSLGYTSVEDPELLVRLRQLQGQEALEAFTKLLCDLDLDG